jgi:hypothetical protein
LSPGCTTVVTTSAQWRMPRLLCRLHATIQRRGCPGNCHIRFTSHNSWNSEAPTTFTGSFALSDHPPATERAQGRRRAPSTKRRRQRHTVQSLGDPKPQPRLIPPRTENGISATKSQDRSRICSINASFCRPAGDIATQHIGKREKRARSRNPRTQNRSWEHVPSQVRYHTPSTAPTSSIAWSPVGDIPA